MSNADFAIDVVQTDLVIDLIADPDIDLSFEVTGPPGPQGLPGEQGDPGDPGPPGPAGGSYLHDQIVPSDTWSIIHNLGIYPNVTVLDTTNRNVVGEVAYPDTNTVVVTFNNAFSGKAFLS